MRAIVAGVGVVGAVVLLGVADALPGVVLGVIAAGAVAAIVGWLFMERRLDREAGIR